MCKMVRVITQETFDNVVKENMEEFDMGKEEAINEAKEQFETQVQKWKEINNLVKNLKVLELFGCIL